MTMTNNNDELRAIERCLDSDQVARFREAFDLIALVPFEINSSVYECVTQ
jgi:hypothetical protein